MIGAIIGGIILYAFILIVFIGFFRGGDEE